MFVFLISYFKQNVSMKYSTVKISDEVPRHQDSTINAVRYTQGLEDIFINNTKKDKNLR